MPADLLKEFGLGFHPFTDRIAEKSNLDPACLYVHSDLAHFQPSETTYVFFGRRGSGKTTIRMQMQAAYNHYNAAAKGLGRSQGFFVVDLCRPGHMTACLRSFQEAIGSNDENWDASFGEAWTSADLVDCILAYTATRLVDELAANTPESKALLDKVQINPKAARQMLLLAHLYAKTDASTLAMLRYKLVPAKYMLGTPAIVTAAAAAAAGARIALVGRRLPAGLDGPVAVLMDQADAMIPFITRHPRASMAVLAAAGVGGLYYFQQQRVKRSMDRAAQLTRIIRVQKQQPVPVISTLLDALFPPQDRVETIRSLYIGISAHQKLDLLSSLVQLMGYEALAIFGDCFDEVVLLDPVQYPNAIKVFAREVCRNDLLNFGRMHFFFPDSRLALDLNTDRTLKEARFDRHFVRDLTWSRHQLEELAQRRFQGAQRAARSLADAGQGQEASSDPNEAAKMMKFAELFKKVKIEDFSSYLSKLNTPRELMIMMTEMLARIEAHPDVGLTSQDMEIAVTKALEQAV